MPPGLHRHISVVQPDRTGSNRDITVENVGNTGLYWHEPGLHRKCSVVNRELTGARFLIDQSYTGVTSAL